MSPILDARGCIEVNDGDPEEVLVWSWARGKKMVGPALGQISFWGRGWR
jgi:hypothetical protein